MKSLRVVFIVSCLCLFGCAKNPRSVLDRLIIEKHFIPFELPMPATRVGTVFRGNAKELYLVAKPERCFPDLEGDDSLRWTQETDLPDQYRRIEFGFDASLNALLNSGSATLNLKSSAKYVRTVSLEFSGASVEYLEESSFYHFYDSAMGSDCHEIVDRNPFIGQGLRIEAMKFIFKDEGNVAINLNGKLDEIVEFAVGVKWHLENSYTLVIDTPKYIGYRMAKLHPDDREIFYAASANKKGDWQFKSVNGLLP